MKIELSNSSNDWHIYAWYQASKILEIIPTHSWNAAKKAPCIDTEILLLSLKIIRQVSTKSKKLDKTKTYPGTLIF